MSERGALSWLALRLSRHTAAYGVATVIGFAIGVVNLIALTRLLSVEEFGRLAVALFFAALLTVIYNLGTLQGTFLHVFGSSGEEGSAEESRDEEVAADKRRALGSSLTFTVALGAIGTLALAALAEPITDLQIGLDGTDSELRWAAACGAIGAVWRLLINVARYERRASLFFVLSVFRPLAVVAGTITLVALEPTVESALIGTAVGTSASCLVAILLSRTSFRIALDGADVSAITARGRFFVPVIVAFWIIQNVDLYLVSLFSTDAEVARYRVASRIASALSYFVSAFLMAWMPLTRTSLYEAVIRERGNTQATATILTYFVIACIWLLIAISVLADVLIQLAPATYASAASLIPLVGCGFLAYGLFVVVYRGTDVPGKRRLYQRLAALAAVVFLPLGVATTTLLDAYGPPLAQVAAFGLVTVWLLVVAKSVGAHLPLQVRAVSWSALLGGTFLAASTLGGDGLGGERVLLDVALLILFPAALVALGIIDRNDLRRIIDIVVPARRSGARAEILARVRTLSQDDQDLLEQAVRVGTTPSELARQLHLDEEAVFRRTVNALRLVSMRPGPEEVDAEVGRWLLAPLAVAEQDGLARTLWQRGVDPLDLEIISETAADIRRIPVRDWKRQSGPKAEAASSAGQGDPVAERSYRSDGQNR